MPDRDDVRTQSTTIGESIKRLRGGVLMTQDDLAAAAGVSTDLIRNLEPAVQASARAAGPGEHAGCRRMPVW
ncbi:MAG: helix-turn-helix transcriptional regulator [Pseudonocardiaceae bacterium]